MAKNRSWLAVNLVLLTVFTYLYIGIYSCDKLPFYNSSSSYIFSCGFGYFALLLYLSIFWLVITVAGSVYFWKKGKIKSSLKISSTFLAVGVLIFFSIPVSEKVTRVVKQRRQEKLRQLDLQKQQNTVGNYELQGCKDTTNVENIIKLGCRITVNFPGEYMVKGELFTENSRLTRKDETILETHPNVYRLGADSTIELSFEYRHIAKNKEVPNGPYVIELGVFPMETVSQQVEPFTFSGFGNTTNIENYTYKEDLITDYYLGNTFKTLPYKDPAIM